VGGRASQLNKHSKLPQSKPKKATKIHRNKQSEVTYTDAKQEEYTDDREGERRPL
jgi:hypothetical protein